MTRKFRKYKLLLDEGLPPRDRFKILNSRHNLKHIKHDFGQPGISDKEVWKIAAKEGRVVITYNVKDFKKLVVNDRSGVVGISTNLSIEQIDKKLTSILIKTKKSNLYGKYKSLSAKNIR